MRQVVTGAKRGRGRPLGKVHEHLVMVRVPRRWRDMIDLWCRHYGVTRAEGIRFLVTRGVEQRLAYYDDD